jgi:hypothetical protein
MVNIPRKYLEEYQDFSLIQKELAIQEERDRSYIEAYCRIKRVVLLEIRATEEFERPELLYFFNDNLGGYVFEAILGELLESD